MVPDELRFAIRQLRSNVAFSLAVVLTLAVALGTVTAVFTLADPMLFRPLPYPEGDRILRIHAIAPGTRGFVTAADYQRAEQATNRFAAVCSFRLDASGRIDGTDISVTGYSVTAGFFDVFGVRAVLGPGFGAEDYRTGNVGPSRPALIAHSLWRSAFGGRADVIGRTFRLHRDVTLFTVAGVLPARFRFPDIVNGQPAFLTPLTVDASHPRAATAWTDLAVLLRRDVSAAAAASHVQDVLGEVERTHADVPRGRRALLRPLRESLFGRVRTPLLLLLGGTLCALLIACANLAHLFLARWHGRQPELGVRLTLGAGRWQLVRQLTCEAGLLAAIGAVGAVAFGSAILEVLLARLPEFQHAYRLLPATLDGRVLAWTLGAGTAAALLFGLLPAVRLTSVAIVTRVHAPAPRWRRTAAMVAGQAALSATLLVCAGLVVRSFAHLSLQDPGFEPDGLQTVSIEPAGPGARTLTSPDYLRVYDHLRTRLPHAVTLVGGVPAVTLPGTADRLDSNRMPGRLAAYPVAGSFFHVFGVTLVSGRLFNDAEGMSDAPVAVVDAAAAAALWPGQDALGQQIADGSRGVRTVIGVIGTVRMGLEQNGAPGTAYFPLSTGSSSPRPEIVIRSEPGGDIRGHVRNAIREVLPSVYVTVAPIRPYERSLGQPRFLAALLSVLGSLALILTIVGTFGVLQHEVTRRMREMGIRMAVGATAGQVRRLIITRALVPALSGAGIALGFAALWSPRLQPLLHGVDAQDLTTSIGVLMFLVTTVLCATWPAASRASRVEPMAVLRAD